MNKKLTRKIIASTVTLSTLAISLSTPINVLANESRSQITNSESTSGNLELVTKSVTEINPEVSTITVGSVDRVSELNLLEERNMIGSTLANDLNTAGILDNKIFKVSEKETGKLVYEGVPGMYRQLISLPEEFKKPGFAGITYTIDIYDEAGKMLLGTTETKVVPKKLNLMAKSVVEMDPTTKTITVGSVDREAELDILTERNMIGTTLANDLNTSGILDNKIFKVTEKGSDKVLYEGVPGMYRQLISLPEEFNKAGFAGVTYTIAVYNEAGDTYLGEVETTVVPTKQALQVDAYHEMDNQITGTYTNNEMSNGYMLVNGTRQNINGRNFDQATGTFTLDVSNLNLRTIDDVVFVATNNQGRELGQVPIDVQKSSKLKLDAFTKGDMYITGRSLDENIKDFIAYKNGVRQRWTPATPDETGKFQLMVNTDPEIGDEIQIVARDAENNEIAGETFIVSK